MQTGGPNRRTSPCKPCSPTRIHTGGSDGWCLHLCWGHPLCCWLGGNSAGTKGPPLDISHQLFYLRHLLSCSPRPSLPLPRVRSGGFSLRVGGGRERERLIARGMGGVLPDRAGSVPSGRFAVIRSLHLVLIAFESRLKPELTSPARFRYIASMKAPLQTGSSGRVPVVPEMRVLIN